MHCPAAPSRTVPTVGSCRRRTLPEARWKAFYKNRWERRRKLLPNLKLRYPDDDEQGCIAQLAGVRNTPAFAQGIRSIILDAYLCDQAFQTLSVSEVKKTINGVAEQANLLKKMLSQLDLGSGSRGSLMEAGRRIEVELYASQGGMMQLPEYIVLLDALKTSAQRAVSKPMSFPRGAGGNPAFDTFIEQLLMTARMHGGSWTNYRSKDERWTGTLLKALEILKKYLPARFFPPGDLGCSVQHIREKLDKDIARSRGLSKRDPKRPDLMI